MTAIDWAKNSLIKYVSVFCGILAVLGMSVYAKSDMMDINRP